MSNMIWNKVKKLTSRNKQDPADIEAVTADELSETENVPRLLIGKLHEQGAREEQQDCFGVSDEAMVGTRGLLAVVADGMGGLQNGGEVSETVVEAVLDAFMMYQGQCTPEQLLLLLARRAVDSVHELLGAPGFVKSGSTLVMGIVRYNMFSFFSVGDSHVYLYRQGVLTQLNREHIYRNKLALDAINGEIPLQEVYADSRGGSLTSFLGMDTLMHIDMPAEPVRLFPGDKLLLASDGVYNALSGQELAESLDAEPEEAAERLRQTIQEKAYDNQDNYTAVVIGYESLQ